MSPTRRIRSENKGTRKDNTRAAPRATQCKFKVPKMASLWPAPKKGKRDEH